jgi:hypothetical protein
MAVFGNVSEQKVSIKFHISYVQILLGWIRNDYRTTQELYLCVSASLYIICLSCPNKCLE